MLNGENRAAAVIVGLLLVPVLALGGSMFAQWLRDGRSGGEVGPEVPEKPADQYFNPALVYIHGISAIVTVVLVIAAAVAIA